MEIQVAQIIFQIINFGVVFGALSYLLYKPIIKILNERAQKIEEGQVAAQKAIAEQEKIEEMKKQIRQKADKEAAKMLEEVNKAAVDRKSKLTAQAKEEALAEVDRLRNAWNDEKRKSLKDMQSQFSEAVIAAAEKVVGESLSAKTHAKLIEEEFNTLVKSL